MALADLDDFIDRLRGPTEAASTVITVPTATTILGRPSDLWVPQVPAGVAPTTAVVPTRTTAGALGQVNGNGGILGIIGARFNAMNPGTYIIADRLSHQGGLSGTATAAQTTNLPTAALTRYTSGDGVMAMLTIYTQIGTSAVTVTASYTNEAGTSGRTTPTVALGATGFREANRAILLPLQSGDKGVRAVASVTPSATTGTAGNYGVTLFKPLIAVIVGMDGVAVCDFITGGMGGGMPEIVDDACLFPMCIMASTNAMASGAILTTEW